MPIITPTIPTIGQPNASEDVDIVNTLTALLNLVNGNLDASNILNGSITPAELGDIGHADMLQPGVIGATDAAVTAAGSMGLSVATGVCWVVDTNSLMQRMRCNGASLTVPTAHATLPRIDQVIATLTTPGAAATLSVLQGTATAGATNDNRTGAATLPVNSIRLADVVVGAGVTSIVAGNIRDRRSWARGAYYREVNTTGAAGISTPSQIWTPRRIECSGVPIRIQQHIYNWTAVNALTVRTSVLVDGVGVASTWHGVGASGGVANLTPLTFSVDYVPTAGSHLFTTQAEITAGAGTFSINAAAATPMILVLQEQVRQNASNGT